MAITVVVPPSAVPTFPPLSARLTGTYNSMSYTWATHMSVTFAPEMLALASATYNNALEAQGAASTAVSAQVTASASAAVALGAANFKGLWSGLTGSLPKPACVSHTGLFWLLLNDLANVTTSEPGVSADWVLLPTGVVPSQLLSTASATVAGVAGVRYIVAANNVTLQVPASPSKNSYHGISVMSGITGFVWDFGGLRLREALPGAMYWDIGALAENVFYEDATRGYV